MQALKGHFFSIFFFARPSKPIDVDDRVVVCVHADEERVERDLEFFCNAEEVGKLWNPVAIVLPIRQPRLFDAQFFREGALCFVARRLAQSNDVLANRCHVALSIVSAV